MRIMALPPTETNLYLYVRRAHLQTMLWKAADQQGPPNVDITTFGWELTEGIHHPVLSLDYTLHSVLLMLSTAVAKQRGRHAALSTVDGCCNPFTMREEMMINKQNMSLKRNFVHNSSTLYMRLHLQESSA